MAGAAIKGISKLLKRRAKIGGARSAIKATKKKPTPRYRTDSKTGEKFLNRRAKVAGVKPTVSKGDAIPEFIKKRPFTSAGIAASALGAAQYRRKKLYEVRDKQKEKLKKATDEIRDKDKKKKEKRKDNYGGK